MKSHIGILFGIFGTSFLLALSGALMPGPLLTVTIGESARKGAKIGPLLIVGHGMLELVLIVLILWGFDTLLHNDIVLGSIAFIGSAILLWMGFGMIRGLKKMTLDLPDDAKITPGTASIIKTPIVKGILVSISNPYFTIWWLTVGIGYIFYAVTFGIPGIIAFFAGHIFADFLWYTIISLSISLGRRLVTDVIYRGIIGACALFLIIFSLFFFKTGFGYFLKW